MGYLYKARIGTIGEEKLEGYLYENLYIFSITYYCPCCLQGFNYFGYIGDIVEFTCFKCHHKWIKKW